MGDRSPFPVRLLVGTLNLCLSLLIEGFNGLCQLQVLNNYFHEVGEDLRDLYPGGPLCELK